MPWLNDVIAARLETQYCLPSPCLLRSAFAASLVQDGSLEAYGVLAALHASAKPLRSLRVELRKRPCPTS